MQHNKQQLAPEASPSVA